MATKLYCDVCEKEKPLNLLSELFLAPLPSDSNSGYVADVCKDCRDKVLGTLKEFRTTISVSIDIPEEKKTKKGKKETKGE